MLDTRFIAVHKGGLLDLQRHRLLALWAADCAERVLSHYEAASADDRPRRAIEAARGWGRGELPTGAAQASAVAAHRAAREVGDPAAVAAARAAGHAAATAHIADHAPGSAMHALRALAAADLNQDPERAWQLAQLPEAIRELVVAVLGTRKFRSLGAVGVKM